MAAGQVSSHEVTYPIQYPSIYSYVEVVVMIHVCCPKCICIRLILDGRSIWANIRKLCGCSNTLLIRFLSNQMTHLLLVQILQ